MTRSKYKHRKSGNGPYATRRSCGGPSRYSRTLHGVFVRAEPYEITFQRAIESLQCTRIMKLITFGSRTAVTCAATRRSSAWHKRLPPKRR